MNVLPLESASDCFFVIHTQWKFVFKMPISYLLLPCINFIISMTNIDFTEVKIDQIITHHIGNRLEEEGIALSEEASNVGEETYSYLLKYFLHPFELLDFYQFSHSVELEMNEVFILSKKTFADQSSFVQNSQNIAKLLYEHSEHPKIKEGELNVVYFKEVDFNGEWVDAIGIFKSETNVPFLKMQEEERNYSIEHEFGFALKGIDKACLIVNFEAEDGYRVLIKDHRNKGNEAQYWKDDFLQLKSISDDYSNTKELMDITKEFVTKQMPEEFEVERTDKIDLLNRTMDYFKQNESFDKETFEQNVFQDEEVINSFRIYDNSYREENELEESNNFTISDQAVKKQTRSFKSVLKLDKNFHVYIHGDKNLIEKGVENDGRKFYKIYYENEK